MVTVKNGTAGKSQQLQASGTSIGAQALRKKNIQNNLEDSIEAALTDALRNLLRGQGLRDVVATTQESAPRVETGAAPATGAPSAAPGENLPASNNNEPR